MEGLLRTFRGEVPFERVKGLDPRLVDLPADEARGKIQQDAAWLIGVYEPRAELDRIDLGETGSGGGFTVSAVLKESSNGFL